MPVPYTFANQTGPIPLNELDANFAMIPDFANTAGTVTESNQSNITAVGTLTSLSVSGNISATGLTVTTLNSTTAAITGNATTGNISTTGITTVSATVTGNLTIANISATGNITSTANVTGGNLITSGRVVATGNVVGGNLITAGQVSATGNITGGNISATTDVAIGGNLVVTGNATINGTTTTVNSQTLNIADKDIVVANNVSTSSLINGAGILAGNPTVSSLIYSHANLGWGTANNFNVGGTLTVVGDAFATTPANATSNTQVATTAFVQNVVINATGSLGTMSTQNASNVAITGGNINSLAVTSIGNNSFGTRTVSSSAPSGGSNGDIWYKI